MSEKKQKTFYVNSTQAKNIINYLQTQGSIYSGVFDMGNKGRIKIQPYQENVEVLCNCEEEMINKLEGMAK